MCKKLIIYIGTLQSGGAERVVSEISSMYSDYFHEVVILTYYNTPVFYKIDQRVRIDSIEGHTGTINKFKNGLWLRKFVKGEKPDVFLSFLMPFNMMSIIALAFLPCKRVVCERQDPSDVKTPLLRIARNFLYHFCSRIEVQTVQGKHYFSKRLQKKIAIIPNPNHITFAERKYALSTPKEHRVVMVGRLIPLKNHSMVINIFSRINKVFPDYRLDIYGDGESYSSLSDQIQQLGLKEVVTLCGRSKDVPHAISSARVFIQSSNVEGMPNALMEAMALGLPCISTDVSGVRDIIDNGINGFIVPVQDEMSMEKKLVQLLSSESLQQQFSDNSIAVMEKFDKQKIFKLWLDLVLFE